MSKDESKGTCLSCGQVYIHSEVHQHIMKCISSNQKKWNAKTEPSMLLHIESLENSLYWLDVLAKPELHLKQLDTWLRKVWLECCGHMSQFMVSPYRKISMAKSIKEVFARKGSWVGYEYDFGTPTELVIRLVDKGNAFIRGPLLLAARNEAPIWPCIECDKPASQICAECACKGSAFFCDNHSESHECGEEMLMPVINSPRMGVCGYTGEA